MKTALVLLVDDDKEALKIQKKYLEMKGYLVETCENGEEAAAFLEERSADCIILDVMMPGEDGFRIFPRLRSLTAAPILFLSGKGEEEDRIQGLALGADDYIVKPCSLEELSLRIGINIRKSRLLNESKDRIEIPPLTIQLLEGKVYFNETEVLLSNREYELMLLFARNPDHVLTFEEIGNAMNGCYHVSDRQSVMMSVSRLRKKLETFAGTTGLIETVWGRGYRLKT